MKPLVSSLCIAFSMYSAVPMPRADWKKENMRWVMCFFPLVGAVSGGLLFAWLWLAARWGLVSSLTAAAACVLPVFVTGGIHLDGYCDTADALASHAPPERALEILKDSHAGAFAVIACAVYFLLAFGLWSQYAFSARSAGMLAAGFVLSRALSGLSVVSFPCAKTSGLAALFSGAAEKRRVRAVLLVWTAVAGAAMLWLSPIAGMGAFSAALAVFFYYRRMAVKRFGGLTGDLAGWFLQVCELAQLAAAILCTEAVR